MSDITFLILLISVPSLVVMTIGFVAMWRERHWKESTMAADMTDEEYDALDEEMTKADLHLTPVVAQLRARNSCLTPLMKWREIT